MDICGGGEVAMGDDFIETDDETAADQDAVELFGQLRQVADRRHGVGPLGWAFCIVGKTMQLNRAKAFAQFGFGEDWEQQVTIVLDIEGAEDADVPGASSHLHGAVPLLNRGFVRVELSTVCKPRSTAPRKFSALGNISKESGATCFSISWAVCSISPSMSLRVT